MLESNSPRPLFEALLGKAGQAKHWALAVQTEAPGPEPQQNLQYRPGGQWKAAQLPVVFVCPGKSPNYRSQVKKPLSGEGDVPETSREPGSKGTFATTEGFERRVALPLFVRPQVLRLARRLKGPLRLPSPPRRQVASFASRTPTTAH